MTRFVGSMLAILLVALSAGAAEKLPDFTPIVDKSGPAVVNIQATHLIDLAQEGHGQRLPDDETHRNLPDFLERFFGDPEPEGPLLHESIAAGSGFIISPDGYLITNYHVVEQAERILVRLKDRREMTARLVGADPPSDIALLKLDGNDLPSVVLGSSDSARVGEWVLAIGSPFNFEHSVTAGIVSAKGRTFVDQQYVPFIQTDVPINRGNSGGPLINMAGQVIGVNSQIYSENGTYMGLSFAIPIEIAMAVVDQLKQGEPVRRGLLGVGIEDVSRDLADAIGLETPRGAIITSIRDGSAADRAGLEVWDVILGFNGRMVHRFSDLPPMVGMTAPGSSAMVTLFRDGRTIELPVSIGEFANLEPVETARAERSDEIPERLGLELEPLGEVDGTFRTDLHGLRIAAVHGWLARQAGFRTGDVIMAIDRQSVETLADFDQRTSAARNRPVAFLVRRGLRTLFIVVRTQSPV